MPETLASGRYVRLVREGRWEWCERVNACWRGCDRLCSAARLAVSFLGM